MVTDKEFFENNDILKEINGTSSKDLDVITENNDKYDALCKKTSLTLRELLDLPTQDNDYYIDGFLWKRQSVMVGAKDKVGKSVTTMNMAANLTTGEPFLGCYAISGKYKVAYVQCEGSREASKGHFESMIKGGAHIDLDTFGYLYSTGLSLHTLAGGQEFIEMLETLPFEPDIVFIDPIYKTMCGGDPSSSKDTIMFTKNIDLVKERFNCAVVCCHHKRKTSKNKEGRVIDLGDEEMFGSAFFKAYFDHTINMVKNKNDSRTLLCDTQRNGSVPKNTELAYDFEHKIITVAGSNTTITTQDIVFNTLAKHKEAHSGELAIELGLEVTKVYNAMAALVKKKMVKVSKKDVHTYYKVV